MGNEIGLKDLRIFRKAEPVRIEPISDVRIAELNAALGIQKKDGISILDFATFDIEEILYRQRVTEWLMIPGNAELAYSLENLWNGTGTFPDFDAGFIEYYNDLEEDATNFWLRTKTFMENFGSLNSIDRQNLPFRIEELLDELRVNGPIFLEKEKSIAGEVIMNMRSMVSIEGIVKFEIDAYDWRNGRNVIDFKRVKAIDEFCFGVRQYDISLDEPQAKIKIPSWTGKIGRAIGSLADSIAWEKRHKPSRIKRVPDPITNDIAAFINQLFKEKSSLPDDEVNSLELEVAYQFGASGLCIQIVGWNIGIKVKGTNKEKKADSIIHPDFKDDNNHRRVEEYSQKVAGMKTNLVALRKHAVVEKWLLDISDGARMIEAPLSSEEFCLSYFKAVYRNYEKEMKEIKDWQAMIGQAFDDIVFLNGIIEKMCQAEVPCSVPEFVIGGAYEFKDIYPLRLASVSKELLPFSAFFVNGKIVNLTGRNGSGKTTLQLSILDAVIMAMSGLPVPVGEMKLPFVETILLSFLDRVINRSVFQAKLQKDTCNARIIREMLKDQKQRVLVINDEVGSATTEDGVLPLEQDYLSWLKSQNISVIMSTQIPRLSKFVEEELGGTNLIIKLEEEKRIYEVSEGIGEGEPIALAREVGLLDIINS